MPPGYRRTRGSPSYGRHVASQAGADIASWTLVDANAIVIRHPRILYKPDAETINRVAAREGAKLIFAFDTDSPSAPRTEWLWATVEGIEADGAFSGRLDNYPQYIRDLSLGERIVFEARHIISTEHDPQETPISCYARRRFVTRRVIDGGKAVDHLYRETPEEENDSGWRLMTGNESDDYTNTTRTTAYVNLGSVLSADDSVLPLFDASPGRALGQLADGSFIKMQGPKG